MKQFNLIKKTLFTVVASAVILAANAQTARFQLIHNAADPALDTVDIYVDGNKMDNVSFRQATGIITATTSTVKININDRTSTDSSDQVVTRFTQTLAANSNTVMMLVGVINTASFLANPNATATDLKLVTKTLSTWSAGAGKVQVNIFHGVTDAPNVDLFSRPTIAVGTLPTNFGYAQANTGTQAMFFNSVNTYLEMRLTGTKNSVKAYNAILDSFNKQIITVFASGFVNSIANQNGKSMGMFAVDTNGTVTELKESTRIQFINNIPDSAAKSVDLYLNNIKVISALNFRSASPFFTINAENAMVKLTTANKNDTLLLMPTTFTSGKSYIAMAYGLKDTSIYASNPEGINRLININGFDSMPEGSLVTNYFQYIVGNGSPDAPQISINKANTQSTTVSELSFGKLSSLKTDNTNLIFNISNNNKSAYNGAYLLNAASWLNQSGIIFTSGFYNTTGNPTSAATFKVMVALNNGTVIELSRLKNKLQFIHNSPDTTIRKIDIYANGVKIVDDLGFRKTTGIATTDAYVPVRVNLTNGNAADTNNALWSVNLLPDSNFNVAIAYGFTGTAFRTNPEGLPSNFDVKMISPAKINSTFASPTNEISFFHGCVNLPKINMQGEQEALFVAKNTVYGTTYKYSPTKGNSGATYFVKNAVSDSLLITAKVNFVGKSGLAGIMFASGISLNLNINSYDSIITIKTKSGLKDSLVKYHIVRAENPMDSMLNQADNNLKLGFYIAWSNGVIDTFEMPKFKTNVNEIANVKNNNHFVIYPNPASDKISIAFNSSQLTKAHINIFNIKGELIKNIETTFSLGNNNIEMPITDLSKGMYFVQIATNENSFTKKIIVE